MKFLHAMIRVKDLEKSMNFYEGLLDLNKTDQVELDDCTLYYLSDEDGQTQIEITYNKETPEEGYKNGNLNYVVIDSAPATSITNAINEMQ